MANRARILSMSFCVGVFLVLRAEPVPAGFHPNSQRGFEAESFAVGDLDSVNSLSGNLVANISLGVRYSVSPTLSYQFRAVYNSNAWEQIVVSAGACEYTQQVHNPDANAGHGWSVSFGHLWRSDDKWLNEAGVLAGSGLSLYAYVSPDGAHHPFFPKLREQDVEDLGDDPNDVLGQKFLYTRDGSLLRLRVVGSPANEDDPAAQWFEIDFPDGQEHRFRRTPAGAGEKPLGGRLMEMRDRFNNWVRIAYVVDGWTVTDSTSRTPHKVVAFPAFDEFPERVTQLQLAGPEGTLVNYNFIYDDLEVSRDLPNGPPTCGFGFPDRRDSVFPQLTALVLPDGTSYGMTYSGPDSPSPAGEKFGRMTSLELPLGGRVEWIYGRYALPTQTCLLIEAPREHTGFCPLSRQGSSFPWGVKTRTLKDGGSTIGTWHYFSSLGYAVTVRGPSEPLAAVEAKRSFLQLETGVLTNSYFSVNTGEPQFEVTSPIQYFKKEYGLPFVRSRKWPSTNPPATDPPTLPHQESFLSTETYQCTAGVLPTSEANPEAACERKRSTYLLYEQDNTGEPETDVTSYEAATAHSNRRLLAQRTIFHDDPVGIAGKDRFSAQDYLTWNGYGHFRSMESVDNFRTMGRLRDRRTEVTEWDATAADRENWMLNRFHLREQTEGTSQEIQEYQFDPSTGFLLCERRRRSAAARNATDTLKTYVPDARGQVFEERWYGGDESGFGLPDGSEPLCDSGSAPSRYGLRHLYSSGVRSSTVPILGGASLADPSLTNLRLLDLTIDPGTGLVAKSRDAAGLETNYVYEAMGRLTSATPAGDKPTKYSYFLTAAQDASLQCRLTAADHPPCVIRRVGDSAGTAFEEERWSFDGFGRLKRHDMRRPGTGAWDGVTTTYNAVGWVTKVSERGSDKATEYKMHDAFGRPGRVLLPDGATTDFLYFGTQRIRRISKVWNGLSSKEANTNEYYDGLGRLLEVDEADGTRTKYEYDVAGRLTEVEHNVGLGGNNRHFTYDGRGFLTEETQPESGLRTFLYDAKGNLTVSVRNDGSNLRYRYDAAGRLREVSSPLALQRTFEYGVPDPPTQASANPDGGKLVRADAYNWRPLGSFPAITCTSLTVRQQHSYSAVHGRIEETRTTLLEGAGQREQWLQSYDYDGAGRLQTITYPDCATTVCQSTSRTVTTDYSYGRPTSIQTSIQTSPLPSPPQSLLSGAITYHSNGLVNTIPHGNLATYQQTPDVSGMARPGKIKVTRNGVAVWPEDTYAYDEVGNIMWIGPVPAGATALPPAGAQRFSYDLLSRLRWVKIPGITPYSYQEYEYDALGNRTKLSWGTLVPGTLDPVVAAENMVDYAPRSSNQLSGALYTQSGSIASYQGASYQWDRFDNLRSATSGTDSWIHAYDASNERVWSWRTGPTRLDTFSLRGVDGKVLREFTKTPSAPTQPTWEDYIYREGQLLASIRVEGATQTLQHFDLDHLGSVRLITDSDGVATKHSFWPYGEEYTSALEGEQMKFTGHERDLGVLGSSSDDMDYMHARYYRPGLGRFLSVDRHPGNVSDPQGWNRYSYAHNNPVARLDPNGLKDTVFVFQTISMWTSFDFSGMKGRIEAGGGMRVEVVNQASKEDITSGLSNADNTDVVVVLSHANRTGLSTNETFSTGTLTGQEITAATAAGQGPKAVVIGGCQSADLAAAAVAGGAGSGLGLSEDTNASVAAKATMAAAQTLGLGGTPAQAQAAGNAVLSGSSLNATGSEMTLETKKKKERE